MRFGSLLCNHSFGWGVSPMAWFRSRKKPEVAPGEKLIRVCVVSRDPALTQEVHKDLLVGFLTRSGYDFESDHPDFQQYCDVLFVDLRAAGLQADPQHGLAFVDAVRQSVSHPPVVALCDPDAHDFAREVMLHGAYDKLTAPLNMPQLRLALQRAYELRSAENRLESFLSQQTAERERRQGGSQIRRKIRTAPRAAAPAPAPPRRLRRSAQRRPAPSLLAAGFALGCLLFFAGLFAVRTVLVGMGDALASAGFAADSGGTAATPNTSATSGGFASHGARPVANAAGFTQPALEDESDSASGYAPAIVLERVEPRYSALATAQHLQGTVRIRAVIGTDGSPRGLARVSGDSTLAQIAMDAISLWRYQPAMVDGQPVESEVIIPIDFHLPN
jgi:TonB family protein